MKEAVMPLFVVINQYISLLYKKVAQIYTYYITMQNLRNFLESYQINEHLIDSAPQLIIMIGLPASGKSTFINKYLEKYFPNVTSTRHINKTVKKGKELSYQASTRLLDSDVQLHKHQKLNAEMFCKKIYSASNEDEFMRIKQEELDRVNNSKGQKDVNTVFNLSVDWDWVEEHKQDKFSKFYGRFLNDFFKKDYAIDFSSRPTGAKTDYATQLNKKLNPHDYDGLETFNNNDVVLATCGDSIEKLRDIISKAGEDFVPSIVFLDMPLEVSVEKDEGRRQKEGRGVGRKIIEGKAEGLKQVWDYLSRGGFRKENIYKMIHMVYEPDNGWGHYEFEKEYINTQMIKDYMN